MRWRLPVHKQVNTRTEFPLTRWSTSPVIVGIGVGLLVGPLGLRLIEPQLSEDGALIQSLSEAVLLICLFCAGLRLRAPLELGALAAAAAARLAHDRLRGAAVGRGGASDLRDESAAGRAVGGHPRAHRCGAGVGRARFRRGRTGVGTVRSCVGGCHHERDRCAGSRVGADADGLDGGGRRRARLTDAHPLLGSCRRRGRRLADRHGRIALAGADRSRPSRGTCSRR